MEGKQTIQIEGRTITYEVYPAYIGYHAVEENYDGPEDHHRFAWAKTPELAVAELVEKMTDYIIERNPNYLID